MKHSEVCECPSCASEHPPLVLWKMGNCKVTSVELREATWYVNYYYTNNMKSARMKLYKWNISAIQYRGEPNG